MFKSPGVFASLLTVVFYTGCTYGELMFPPEPGPKGEMPSGDPDDATVLSDLRLVMFDGTELRDSKFGLPIDIAISGRMTLHLRMAQPDGSLAPFGRRYRVNINDGRLVKLEIAARDGDDFVLRGLPDDTTSGIVQWLTIEDPENDDVLGRFKFISRPVRYVEIPLADHWVYMPGTTVTPEYSSLGVESEFDETATLTGEGITQTAWNQFRIDTAVPGTHTVTARAGDHAPVALHYIVVGEPDRIEYKELAIEIAVGKHAEFCFDAWHGGQEVHALWSYTSSNGAAQPSAANEGCVEVTPTLAGPLTVTARAGSATVSKQFTVAAR